MVNLEHIEDKLIEMYEQLTLWAINDIVERIIKTGILTETAKYRIIRLEEAGIHLRELKKRIQKISGKSEREVNRIFKMAALEDLKFNNEITLKNESFYISDQIKYIIGFYASRTNNEFENLRMKFLPSSINSFLRIMDRFTFRVVSGIQSQSEAIKEVINTLGDKGINIVSFGKKKESIESAVRRIIHTGVNKCLGSINLQKAKDNGYNHVLVSSHLGARHVNNPNPIYLSHDIWQGKVYNIDWSKTSII